MSRSSAVASLLITGAAIAGSACSSSSGDASPTREAGAEASVPFDAGVHDAASPPRGLTLTWNVTAPALVDGGVLADAGASDGAADGAVLAEGGVSDAGALDAGALDAGTSDAGASDAGPDAAAATNVPVAGATVCVYQKPSIGCVTTDATGLFTLTGLPATTNVPIMITLDGYRPQLVPIQTASTNMDETARPIGLQRVQADESGPDPVDWTNDAVVTFFAVAPLPGSQLMFGGDPGASVALAPAAGNGPYYLYDDGTYATSATALVAIAGVYANVPPGTYTITLADPNHDCSPILTPFAPYGYPAGALSVTFPALAGYITGPVGFFCTDKTGLVDAGQ